MTIDLLIKLIIFNFRKNCKKKVNQIKKNKSQKQKKESPSYFFRRLVFSWFYWFFREAEKPIKPAKKRLQLKMS
jgi:hypothetical protein